MPAEDERYDLVHVRLRPWRGRPRSAALLGSDFEFLGLTLPLEAARDRRRALDRHGITVHIVPVRYRETSIEPAQAERQARRAAAPGGADRPGAERLLAVHPMLYIFTADGPADPTASRVVAVDRCDGHLWTDAEMVAYFALVGRR